MAPSGFPRHLIMDRRDFCEVLASLAHRYTKLTGNLMTELRSRESLLLAVSTKIPTFALTQQGKTNKGKKNDQQGTHTTYPCT